MNKQPTILEEALHQVRDLYAPTDGCRIEKIQQNIAVGVISGLIAVHNASERVCTTIAKRFQEHMKSRGR